MSIVSNPDAGIGRLLLTARFLPHFLTQFLGAFNDNVFKQALIIFITFQVAGQSSSQSAQLVTAAAGVFVLPFLLASPLAGQLADKYPKTQVIRYVKLAEVFIMLTGAAAFWVQSLPALMTVLFCMGLQSSIFGPLKYGVLPQLLAVSELPAGNGLIQAATYVAILCGTLFGGILMAEQGFGWGAVSVAVIIVSILGLAASYRIPIVPAAAPTLSVDWNMWRQAWVAMSLARQTPVVFASIVGISWFWFLGATNLQLLPSYGKDVLGGDAQVVTLLLVTFSIGIGLGALSCASLMRRVRSVRLVTFGAAGMSGFGIVPWVVSSFGSSQQVVGGTRNIEQLLSDPGAWPVLGGFLGLAICGGLYVVPLFVTMQTRSKLEQRSRVIAANNIMNALFMVASAAITYVLIGLNWSLGAILASSAALSVGVLMMLLRRLNVDATL